MNQYCARLFTYLFTGVSLAKINERGTCNNQLIDLEYRYFDHKPESLCLDPVCKLNILYSHLSR